MEKFLIFLTLLIFYYRPVLCTDEHVIRLTDRNFKKQLATNDFLLVMFFLPWSPACQKYRHHFATAGTILKTSGYPVALGKIDCSLAGRMTCEHEQIVHHPSIKFYKKGKYVSTYHKSRDAHSIVTFMTVQIFSNPVELNSVDEFKSFLKNQIDPVVVGFFEEESTLKRVFFRIIKEMKESILFAYSSCEKLLMREGVMNGIVVFRPESFHNSYENDRALFTGRTIIGEIKNFIVSNYHGLVGHRTPNNVYDFGNPLVVLFYTTDYKNIGKEFKYWKTRIIKLAHKYQKHVRFAISAKDSFEEELANFNVSYKEVMKPFILGRDLENKRYIMGEEFSTKTFDRFLDAFINRTISPVTTFKSSQHEYDGSVMIATFNNFQEIVLNADKDILIDMYAPERGRYEEFIPILREVADLLQGDEISVVKMDTTKNIVPHIFDVKTVPNLFWLPKNKKHHPVLYQGKRTIDDIMKYVAKEAAAELMHYDRNGNLKLKKDEL